MFVILFVILYSIWHRHIVSILFRPAYLRSVYSYLQGNTSHYFE